MHDADLTMQMSTCMQARTIINGGTYRYNVIYSAYTADLPPIVQHELMRWHTGHE